MASLYLQAITAGEQALRRRLTGPPQTLAGRLRAAIRENNAGDVLMVKRVAGMLMARGQNYAHVGRAARLATVSVRATGRGRTGMARAARTAALDLLVGA